MMGAPRGESELPGFSRKGTQPSPFVEYEDKEKNRTQERIWLLEDRDNYMDNRLRGLRQQTIFHRQLSATSSAPNLPRIQPSGGGRPGGLMPSKRAKPPAAPAALPKKDSPPCIKSLKGLQRELKESLQQVERSSQPKPEPKAELRSELMAVQPELSGLSGLLGGNLRW